MAGGFVKCRLLPRFLSVHFSGQVLREAFFFMEEDVGRFFFKFLFVGNLGST